MITFFTFFFCYSPICCNFNCKPSVLSVFSLSTMMWRERNFSNYFEWLVKHDSWDQLECLCEWIEIECPRWHLWIGLIASSIGIYFYLSKVVIKHDIWNTEVMFCRDKLLPFCPYCICQVELKLFHLMLCLDKKKKLVKSVWILTRQQGQKKQCEKVDEI